MDKNIQRIAADYKGAGKMIFIIPQKEIYKNGVRGYNCARCHKWVEDRIAWIDNDGKQKHAACLSAKRKKEVGIINIRIREKKED